jgi:hypothetical protein
VLVDMDTGVLLECPVMFSPVCQCGKFMFSIGGHCVHVVCTKVVHPGTPESPPFFVHPVGFVDLQGVGLCMVLFLFFLMAQCSDVDKCHVGRYDWL